GNFPARGGLEVGGQVRQVATDEGEEVARLGMRIAPDGKMALATIEHALLDRIAVRQQDRRLIALRLEARRVGGQDVRSIEKIGDATEALGFTLRAVDAARAVKTRQCLVGLRVAEGEDLQGKGAGGRLADHEL